MNDIRDFVKSFKGRVLNSQDNGFKEFIELLSNHPTWKDKLTTIEAIKITTSHFKNNNSLILKIKPQWCHKFITISWRKCKKVKNKKSTKENKQPGKDNIRFHSKLGLSSVQNAHCDKISVQPPASDQILINPKTKLIGAMRYAIKKQVRDFKRSKVVPICTQCKQTTNLQVDHIIPFSKLQQDFLAQLLNSSVVAVPESFDFNRKTCQPKFKKENQYFKSKWQKYHKTKAQYQYLCRTCNIKKSDKI